MSDKAYKRIKTAELCVFFLACFAVTLILKIENAPDEAMRDLVTRYIFETGRLPIGNEPEIIHPIWGFSYAYHPYMTSIVGAMFMKVVSIATSSGAALLAAARFASVLSGTGALFFVFRIGEQLFEDKRLALLLGSFVGFLPQFIFLSSYQNNDCFAIFAGAVIIYFWVKGIKSGWSLSCCVGLGIGCGICALSYYNAYVYILASIFLYFGYRAFNKDKASDIFKGAAVILIIALIIGGWFFVRNMMIHNGDIFGFRSIDQLAEQYAMDGYKPSQLRTPADLGMSFADTFIKVNQYQKTPWFLTAMGSFFGAFSNMTAKLPMAMYAMYFILVAAGIIICLITEVPKIKKTPRKDRMINIALLMVIVINIVLFMYYTYYSDYQAQGRYMMPSLIPLMLMNANGWSKCKARALALRLVGIVYVGLGLISYFGFLIPSCA